MSTERNKLHKALVRRAIQHQTKNTSHLKENLWLRNDALLGYRTDGWCYSWYTYVAHRVTPVHQDERAVKIPYLSDSLHEEAVECLKKEQQLNTIIISISTYVDKILTLYDSCISLAYPHLPPYLHETFKDMNISLDPNAKYKEIHLNQDEIKGKEELYALNLLEMTGD